MLPNTNFNMLIVLLTGVFLIFATASPVPVPAGLSISSSASASDTILPTKLVLLNSFFDDNNMTCDRNLYGRGNFYMASIGGDEVVRCKNNPIVADFLPVPAQISIKAQSMPDHFADLPATSIILWYDDVDCQGQVKDMWNLATMVDKSCVQTQGSKVEGSYSFRLVAPYGDK